MLPLFSVDDHVIEHAGVWQDRVPARLRDAAPKVVADAGREYWEFEGRRAATMGLNAVAGKPREQWDHEPTSFSDMIEGCYDPVARTRDMQANGIFASVCFPTLPRFGGALFNEFKDRELAAACVRAWNDFILDEWCAAAPRGQFVPMVIGMLWDPIATVKELERCAAKGARAFCMVENPAPLGLPSWHTRHWDPLWAGITELGLPVCMHIGSSGVSHGGSDDAPHIVATANGAICAWVSANTLALSGTFQRFPSVQVVFSEGGIGWIPAAVERADRQFIRHRQWQNLGDGLPSEVYRNNFNFCMIDEPWGLTQRAEIGVDRIMWECDYPHADTPWPDTQATVAELFDGVSTEDLRAITSGNAERLFSWTMAAPGPVRTPA